MPYYKDNKGLIATQNRDRRMAYESLLKSYSATINGSNGDKDFLKLVFGKDEYQFLTEVGLTEFAHQKTKELYVEFPFPDDTSDKPSQVSVAAKKRIIEQFKEEQGDETRFNEVKQFEDERSKLPIIEE